LVPRPRVATFAHAGRPIPQRRGGGRRSAAGLLALGALSALYFGFKPILRSRATRGLLVVLVAAAESAALVHSGPTNTGFFVVNNAVVIVGAVGVANLWAQSGMKAGDAAILGAALAAYDLVATSLLPWMSDLFAQLSQLPFAPIVGWPAGQDGRLSRSAWATCWWRQSSRQSCVGRTVGRPAGQQCSQARP
jgi:hypothetical protein